MTSDSRTTTQGKFKRRQADGESLVVAGDPVTEAGSPPVVLVPRRPGIDLAAWLRSERDRVERDLLTHGAVLFRGFGVESAAEFQRVATALGELVEYAEPSTPRGQYMENVYVSSEFPSYYTIPPHGELSYTHIWPRKALFFCKLPSRTGGQTPLADARTVLARLDDDVRERFLSKGIMYVRNYGDGFVLPWQEVFKTDSRDEVEAYCRANEPMTCEWLGGDRLRTRQVRPAFATHPDTGETVWFNQVHIFHTASLGAAVKARLLEELGEDNLPVHARFGDGEPIPDSDIEHIIDTYRECSIAFDWQRGDVMVNDNLLFAHGRNAFEGDREIIASFVGAYDARRGREES
jgi:alpha-ketoglutarate-dependent taurine dioxygenase